MTGLSCSRHRPRDWSGACVRPEHGSDISLFPPASYACHEPRRLWILIWSDHTPDHVEQLVEPERRVR